MEDTPRACRICLDGPEAGRELIEPCACRGSMRWVHADCLSEWWQHRAGGLYDAPSAAVKCDICHEILAHTVHERPAWRTRCLRTLRSCFSECCMAPFSDFPDNLRHRTEEFSRNKFIFIMTCLLLWWGVAVTYRPRKPTPPPYVLELLGMGEWVFPAGLWCGVIMLVAAPTLRQWDTEHRLHWMLRHLILDHGQDQRILYSLCFLISFGPVTALVKPPTSLTSTLAVVSPAVPLMYLKLKTANWSQTRDRVWPPHEQLLHVQTHALWISATLALTISFFINFSGWLFMSWLTISLVPLPDAQRERLIQQQDSDSKLFGAVAAAGGISAVLHFPLVLRSIAASLQLEQQDMTAWQVERWSRTGASALFTAAICLLWLAARGLSYSICIVFLWAMAIVFLTKRLGISSFEKCLQFASSSYDALRAELHMTVWRQSLQAGDVAFTSRGTRNTDPLLRPDDPE